MAVDPPKFVKRKSERVSGLGDSKHLKPWTSTLTPNQTHMIISMLVTGEQPVTCAARCNTTSELVATVASEYRNQIEALQEDSEYQRASILQSMWEQMVRRWELAGNRREYQPEEPVTHLPPSHVHKPSRATGNGVYKAFTEGV